MFFFPMIDYIWCARLIYIIQSVCSNWHDVHVCSTIGLEWCLEQGRKQTKDSDVDEQWRQKEAYQNGV